MIYWSLFSTTWVSIPVLCCVVYLYRYESGYEYTCQSVCQSVLCIRNNSLPWRKSGSRCGHCRRSARLITVWHHKAPTWSRPCSVDPGGVCIAAFLEWRGLNGLMHHDGKRPGKTGGHLISIPKAQYPPRWFKKSCNYLYMALNEDPGNHGSLDLGGSEASTLFFFLSRSIRRYCESFQ